MNALPLASAASFVRDAQRTFAVRTLLALVAIAAVVAFLLVSRNPHTKTLVPLRAHGGSIVVLDLSASISSDTFSRIGGTLAELSRGGGRLGLVVFSDTAYEALPPETPARDLAPLVRYFTLPVQSQPGFAPSFPANPWQAGFSGGTKISAGLELAHTLALAGGRPAPVVLISDLDDDPSDLTTLASVSGIYRHDHIPMRIVGLDPLPADVVLFNRLFAPRVSVSEAPTLNQVPPHDVTPFPWSLVALAAVAAVMLATRNAWSPRLVWGGR